MPRPRFLLSFLECGDSSPLSFLPLVVPGSPREQTKAKESGDESPHSKKAKP
jgi:hypothetical protein